MRIKNRRNKKKLLLFGIVAFILILTALIVFILINNQRQNTEDEKKYCTESSRNANMCVEIYEPVCGFPAERTYSNSCFACMNSLVEYYLPGECLLQ